MESHVTHKQRLWLYILTALILLFLVVPTLIVVPMSFSSANSLAFPPPGWSLRWYQNFFEQDKWLTAALVSLRTAFGTMIVATTVGTAAAYSLHVGKFALRGTIYATLAAPLAIPAILLAIGLFFVYASAGLLNTTAGLIIAHTLVAIPFVLITMTAGFKSYDMSQEMVARSLGANRLTAFLTVTLPQVKFSLISAALLAFIVVWRFWRWPIWVAALLIAPFLVIDLVFLGANLIKVTEGGWVPLLFAFSIMVIMRSWVRGTKILFDKSRRNDVPLNELVKNLEKSSVVRVPGTAVFLTSDPETAPSSLLHSLKHYRVLHQKNVLLTVISSNVPRIDDADRIRIEPINDSFTRVFMTFGYMETPNVPKALGLCRKQGWKYDIMSTSFFLSRRSIKPANDRIFSRLQDKLFIKLAINAADATEYFHIPTGRVVEIGTQMTI